MNKIATFLRESGPARMLIPIGLVLVTFGVIMFVINNKNKNYIKIESTVINVVISEEAHEDLDGNHVDATYNVTVKYTVDGKEYEATLDNVSKYEIGDKVKIYYNPKDPSQITMTKGLIIPSIIIGVGIVALVSGIISGKRAIQRYKKMKEQEKGWVNNG